jgi:hypothetical protein
MRKLSLVFAAGLVLLGVVAQAPSADAAFRLRSSHAPEYSINWSGYAVPANAGEQITAVDGRWRVPKVKAAPPGLSSSWIGIGGYRTNDLIQVGTASSGRIEGNYAWYEMLPAFETPITSGCTIDPTCSVAQGDLMSAAIWNTGGDNWMIALSNLGKVGTPKWHWAIGVTYKSTLSSADFIFEAPRVGVPLLSVQTIPAHAPSAKFLGGSVRINGVTKPLAASSPVRIMMNDPALGFVRTATPSLMAPDGHFAVCAYKRTCPNF